MSSKRKLAYQRGKDLEKRVTRWLKTKFDYEEVKADLAQGKSMKRKIDVDIHAIHKGILGLGRKHLWVECKALKGRVKRHHVNKLVGYAREVYKAWDERKETWYPHMLMIVSKTDFDIDAKGLANEHDVYCVEAARTYKFVGKMTRDMFQNKEHSNY